MRSAAESSDAQSSRESLITDGRRHIRGVEAREEQCAPCVSLGVKTFLLKFHFQNPYADHAPGMHRF